MVVFHLSPLPSHPHVTWNLQPVQPGAVELGASATWVVFFPRIPVPSACYFSSDKNGKFAFSNLVVHQIGRPSEKLVCYPRDAVMCWA